MHDATDALSTTYRSPIPHCDCDYARQKDTFPAHIRYAGPRPFPVTLSAEQVSLLSQIQMVVELKAQSGLKVGTTGCDMTMSTIIHSVQLKFKTAILLVETLSV